MRHDPAPKPWFEAVESGDREAVIDMLDRGMEIDARGKIGTTALIAAIRKHQARIVRILLDRGASLEPEDDYGFTAMTHAVILSKPWNEAAEPDPEPLRMLLEAGGRFGLIEAILLGDVELARLRLDEGANPDAGEGRYHGPLLMIAARNGDSGLVGLLLDRGANPEATDDLGMTALIASAGRGHIDIVRTLLDRGAKIDTRDWLQCTSLAHAAAQGRRDVVGLLLSRRAARGLADAVAMEDRGLEERFLQESEDPARALHELRWLAFIAARRGAVEVMRLLLDFGMPLSCADRDGNMLLVRAAKHGQLEAVRFLVGRGADLHARGRDGMTSLAWAIRGDHQDVAAYLRDAGAAC